MKFKNSKGVILIVICHWSSRVCHGSKVLYDCHLIIYYNYNALWEYMYVSLCMIAHEIKVWKCIFFPFSNMTEMGLIIEENIENGR